MKRYLLFGFYNYYPSGGLRDLITSFDSLDEIDAMFLHDDYSFDYYQVFDCLERKEVSYSRP